MIQLTRIMRKDHDWIDALIALVPLPRHPRCEKPRGCALRPIRIVLGSVPRLMRDIVIAVIGSESDMLIVGEAGRDLELDAVVRDAQADIVLCGDASAVAGGKERLLRDHENLKVLVLSDSGAAELSWLEPRRAWYPDLSPDRLVELIRTSFNERIVR